MQRTHWWKKNSKAYLSDAFSEATVDAYGEHEQFSGLLTMIQDRVDFPFEASVAGQSVVVTDAVHSEVDSLGLDLVCKIEDEYFHIAARSVEPDEDLPEGQIFLAAYLDWKSRF